MVVCLWCCACCVVVCVTCFSCYPPTPTGTSQAATVASELRLSGPASVDMGTIPPPPVFESYPHRHYATPFDNHPSTPSGISQGATVAADSPPPVCTSYPYRYYATPFDTHPPTPSGISQAATVASELRISGSSSVGMGIIPPRYSHPTPTGLMPPPLTFVGGGTHRRRATFERC